jgi:monovalent cation:H+ antiporter, CPA1 family
MTQLIENAEFLLLVAALVAMLARLLRLPYTVGLVVTGIGLGFVKIVPDVPLTEGLLYLVLLPPLIFEAAIAIDWRDLRRDLGLIILLATVGVVISAGVTAPGMRFVAGWGWVPAILLAVLIAATDPVSVIATFKDAGIGGRLRLLVEAESLFNDGVVAVLFAVALVVAEGGAVGPQGALTMLAASVVGGILCGLVVGGGALLLAGRTDDHLVEITYTTVAAYGSFLAAQHLHVSGVLATLAAGLLVGNVGSLGAISDRGREAVTAFWEYVAFAVNAVVFLLIGMRVAHQDFAEHLLAIGTAVALVTLGRALSVYGCSALFGRSARRVARSHQHVLFWAGPRGALTLALAIGLPATMPQRDAIVTVAFAVVALSVVVQGLTIVPLINRLGERSVASGAPVR